MARLCRCDGRWPHSQDGAASTIATPRRRRGDYLTGKFVAPGIINAHGHVGAKTEPQLRQYTLYGVTTTTSMQTDPDEVVQVREAQKRGDLRGARVSTVKLPLRARSPVVDTAAGAAKVDETVAAGADYIKVWVVAGSAHGPSSAAKFAQRCWIRRASMASSPSATSSRTNRCQDARRSRIECPRP